jgi:hypothetical protein
LTLPKRENVPISWPIIDWPDEWKADATEFVTNEDVQLYLRVLKKCCEEMLADSTPPSERLDALAMLGHTMKVLRLDVEAWAKRTKKRGANRGKLIPHFR